MKEPVIISAVRTPIGKFQGTLKPFTATQLGSFVVRAAWERAQLNPSDIDEVIMGNVVSAGLGQNPARQAALVGGLPPEVAAMTINKVCDPAQGWLFCRPSMTQASISLWPVA
jgi:acetyl-CoA C-acetyltransferase